MKLYTRNELESGRVFFDKQPPRFMTVFIIFLVAFLVASIIGAQFVKRPYVVKAQGTVSVEGASYLSSKTQGVIATIHAKSGQLVEKGDVILELSSGNEGLQKSVVDAQIAELEDTLLIMDKYELALEQGKNTLSQKGKELEYYGKVAYYLDAFGQESYESNKINSNIFDKQKELNDIKAEIKTLESELSSVNNQITENEKLTERNNQTLYKKETKQQSLINELRELENELSQSEHDEAIARKLAEKQGELDSLSEAIEQVQSGGESGLRQEKLVEKQAELKSDLEMNKSKVEGLEDEIKQLSEESESPHSQAEQIRLQLISELGEKRNQLENQLTELRANSGMAIEQDTVHVLEATKSGVVHYLQPISIGMAVQQNQIIAEIAIDTEDFYVDSYIEAQDRSRVEVGQPVNVAIIGVNNYRFGTISGEVEFIEPGTIQNETAEGVLNLYRLKVNLNEETLTSKSGEMIQLVRAMPVEARIIYQEESYLEWLLNLLNLRSH